MGCKSDLRLLARSAEDLAYALRDTLDVLAEHEARISRIEKKLDLESRIVEGAVVGR